LLKKTIDLVAPSACCMILPEPKISILKDAKRGMRLIAKKREAGMLRLAAKAEFFPKFREWERGLAPTGRTNESIRW
jgi:hypothetical protein